MGHLIVKQPNDKWAIFSTVIDDFVLVDATEQQVEDYELGWGFAYYKDSIKATIERSKKSNNSTSRHRDLVNKIAELHGEDYESVASIGDEVPKFETYTREDLEEAVRGLVDTLIFELGLTQYPKKSYLDVTEKYIKTIE